MSAGAERHGRTDQAWRELFLPAPVGLVAGLTDVLIDLAPRVEPALLIGTQRWETRGVARFAGPGDASEQSRRARARDRPDAGELG